MAGSSAPVMTLPPEMDPAPALAPAPASESIKVTGPDGQVFNFPGDTPEPVMKTALLKHYQAGEGKGWEEKAKAAEAAAADAPASGQAGDASAAVGRGLIEGIPVLGAPLMGVVNRGVAGIRALKNDTRYSDELKNVEQFGERTAQEHPYASTAGEIAGGVIGTAPLMAAAPAAFGIGAASLPARIAASAGSGAVLGGADAAVRSGGDVGQIEKGAALGGAFGAAGPAIGAGVGRMVNAATGGGESAALRLARESVRGIPEEQLGQAQALRETAASQGINLPVDEAVNAASNGQANRLSQMARVVANSGGEGAQIANEVYAARPGQIKALGERTFNDLTPYGMATPTDLGFDLQTAAQRGVAQTPEGRALQAARDAAGPRVTPEQAGQAIQGDLRARADALEAARAQQAATDYAAARAAPETVGMEGPPVTVERPGEPALQTIDNGAMPAPQYVPPPQGPATLASTAPTRPAAQASAPQGPSLARFISQNGGIGLERGDIAAAGLDKFQKPGVAKLVQPDGKSIDNFWRERLIEEGYLPPDPAGGMQRNIHDELINALEEEARGRPTYAYDWQGKQSADSYGRMQDQFQAATDQARSSLHSDLRNVGVDPASVHPEIMDRATAALVRDGSLDPVTAYEQATMAMREPAARGPTSRMMPTTITEQVPTVRWGQVDPRPAMRAVQEQQLSAKGDVRGALSGAERDLYAGGQPDMSVQGLLHARERLDFAIQSAQEAGDRTKVRDLTISRNALDQQLKTVPEVAAADANFAANSRPLEPFAGNGPLAQATRREGNAPGGRLTMPAESVPSMLSGPTAAREAVANGTQATREALAGRVQTQILDGATQNGNVSADALRAGILQHEDTLRQFPEVRARLEAVATRRDAMARIEASPLGQIADQPDVSRAINALFPENSGLNHHVEAARAMEALVRNNRTAAEALARTHYETMFNGLTEGRRGLASQYGGAAFGSAILDNPERAKVLEAVTRALPNGDARWRAIETMAKTLKATGYRPQKGSDTAFNQAIQKEMASGKTPFGEALSNALAGAAAGTLAGGPKGGVAGLWLGAKHGLSDAMTRAQIAKNGKAMAQVLYDPAALPDLRALAKSPPGSRSAEIFTARLIARAAAGLGAPLRQPTLH